MAILKVSEFQGLKRTYANPISMGIEGGRGVEQVGAVFHVPYKIDTTKLGGAEVWIFSVDRTMSAVQIHVGVIRKGNTGQIDGHSGHDDFSRSDGQLFCINLLGCQNMNEICPIGIRNQG